VILFVLLTGCGLLAPGDPPARELGSPDGQPLPDVPIPDPPADVGAPPFPGYRLIWHDEFAGNRLDETKWNIEEQPNRDALAARDSVTVRDGLLRLTTFTDASGVHHTGIIETRSKLEATYGYFEARIHMREASGNWCAFWLYADTIGNPIGDPGTAGVEIDVIEHRFENRDRYDLSNMIYMNLNWDGFGADWKKDGRLTALPGGAPIQDAWRTFAVLWTETGYVFYTDGVPLWKSSAALSHRSEYVYLSCEVKNNSWAGWIPPGGYGTRDASTTGMQVDWVRVWQKG
jgi:beta-glucanase (GH16 family)